MYVVGFNGPPRVGKDSLANALMNVLDKKATVVAMKTALSMPMRRRAFGAIGKVYNESTYERIKDTVISGLGMTLREFMIADSANFMNPTFGQDVWSRLLAESLPIGFNGILLVSDFGFQHEPEYFANLVGDNNCLTVRINRSGHDWKNDSRGWIGDDGELVHCTDVCNNDNPKTLEVEANRIYDHLVNQRGWKL